VELSAGDEVLGAEQVVPIDSGLMAAVLGEAHVEWGWFEPASETQYNNRQLLTSVSLGGGVYHPREQRCTENWTNWRLRAGYCSHQGGFKK
jgi:hypothetical protein